MSSSNYKYTASDGTVYQVTLPDDIATALSNVAAAGTEPYLDFTISPRFVEYQSAAGVLRGGVCGTTALFTGAPSSITLGGAAYSKTGSYGESIAKYIPQNAGAMLAIPGPQGPAGSSGGAAQTKTSVSAAQIKTLLTAPVQLAAAPGAGLLRLPIACVIKNNGGGAAFTSNPTVLLQVGSLTSHTSAQTSLYTSTTANEVMMAPQNNYTSGSLADNQPVMLTSAPNPSGSGTLTWEVLMTYVDLIL